MANLRKKCIKKVRPLKERTCKNRSVTVSFDMLCKELYIKTKKKTIKTMNIT